MATQSVTGDNNVLAILKEFYGEKLEALLFRGDALLGLLRKVRVGGKYVVLPMAVYGNGGLGADYLQVIQKASNSYSGAAMWLYPGTLFSSFVVDGKEFLASQGDTNAFMSVFSVRAMLAMDDLRKLLSQCMYRAGYLEQGVVQAVDTNYLYVDVDPSTAMSLIPNMDILFYTFANGVPSVQRSANVATIKSIGNTQSGYTRVTFTGTYITTVAVGDYLCIKGGMDGSNNPQAPIGFAQWLPTVGNRTGSTWTTYIATKFNNVDRSVAPDRLAGQYIYRNVSQGETYTEALLRGVKVVRRGGGVPEKLVVNDDDYMLLMQDALANRTFFQGVNSADKGKENQIVNGISEFELAFSTSWIGSVIDSPYCPRNLAYILDMESWALYHITDATEVLKELPLKNEPGSSKMTDGPKPTTQFGFLWGDMYTVEPVPLSSGPGERITFSFYGNFGCNAPAKNCVVQFN